MKFLIFPRPGRQDIGLEDVDEWQASNWGEMSERRPDEDEPIAPPLPHTKTEKRKIVQCSAEEYHE